MISRSSAALRITQAQRRYVFEVQRPDFVASVSGSEHLLGPESFLIGLTKVVKIVVPLMKGLTLILSKYVQSSERAMGPDTFL